MNREAHKAISFIYSHGIAPRLLLIKTRPASNELLFLAKKLFTVNAAHSTSTSTQLSSSFQVPHSGGCRAVMPSSMRLPTHLGTILGELLWFISGKTLFYLLLSTVWTDYLQSLWFWRLFTALCLMQWHQCSLLQTGSGLHCSQGSCKVSDRQIWCALYQQHYISL